MSTKQLEKQYFNLKFAAKQLERNAKKCQKEEKEEKLKLKRAIEKGNTEGARIHAENAIRQKNQYANYLRMASRVDGVCSRVQAAIAMKQVSGGASGMCVDSGMCVESTLWTCSRDMCQTHCVCGGVGTYGNWYYMDMWGEHLVLHCGHEG